MGEKKGNKLPKENQKEIAMQLMEKSLKVHDIWCVADYSWFSAFKAFVGWDGWEKGVPDVFTKDLGPIDNNKIIEAGTSNVLKQNLLENTDFVLIPEELWNYFVDWYGLKFGQEAIKRKVIKLTGSNHCQVEVYLLPLKLVGTDREMKHYFSRVDTIDVVVKTAKKLLRIPDEVPVSLVTQYPDPKHIPLDSRESLEELGLYCNQSIIVESNFLFGKPSVPKSKTAKISPYTSSFAIGQDILEFSSSSAGHSSRSKSDEYTSALPLAGTSNQAFWNINTTAPSTSSGLTRCENQCSTVPLKAAPAISSLRVPGSSRMNRPTPGLCGLTNLGNTCFMNSIIQCMSNCPPITKYFLDDCYINELNKENVLGMKGDIAVSYAELVKTIWSGNDTYTVPRLFKQQVGKFAPQFSGYMQHDSQELLTFLLDGLHEDLNRIKQKPYIELKDADGRPDKEVAEESWKNYLQRNNSVIVDYFHGLLKSTVVCPDCSKVSITFDPFCYLTLPLPLKMDRVIEITFFPHDAAEKLCKYKLCVSKAGLVYDLKTVLSNFTKVNPDDIIVASVVQNHIENIFDSNEPLYKIEENCDIFMYEVPSASDRSKLKLVVCMSEERLHEFSYSHLFGTPFIISICRQKVSYVTLYDSIRDKVSRFMLPPDDNRISNLLNMDEESNSDVCANDDPYDTQQSLNKCNGDVAGDKYLFSLCILDLAQPCRITRLHQDNKPLVLPPKPMNQCLLVEWPLHIKTKYFKDDPISVSNMDYHPRRTTGKFMLHECMELFTTQEKLGEDDAWYCPTCKKHQRATKKFDIWKLPQILIIHLKRFSYNRLRRDKIDTLVQFPLKDLDLSSYVINPDHVSPIYDLIGVCNHYGGMGAGHYTAYAKNKLDQKWYCFDDNNVSEACEEIVVSPEAYVLFYMRNDNQNSNRMETN